MFFYKMNPAMVFWPSPKDIKDYKGDNLYHLGLADVRDEVENITHQLALECLGAESIESGEITRVSLSSQVCTTVEWGG